MEKIASFKINHLILMPGIYVSRRDILEGGGEVTTFDLRMTAPNREPALSQGALHALEHIAATWLRNNPQWRSRIVYWGPMGCCTGNYLLIAGHLEPEDIRGMVTDLFRYASGFEGDVPGASPRDCGNYLLMNLPEARMAARRYLACLQDPAMPTAYP